MSTQDSIASTIDTKRGKFNIIESRNEQGALKSCTVRRVENVAYADNPAVGRVEGHAHSFAAACAMVAYIAKVNQQQPKEPGQL